MEDSAYFCYEFEFGDNVLIYSYEKFSDEKVKTERLVIDEKVIFELDFKNQSYAFDNLQYINAGTANTERYLHLDNIEDEMEQVQEPKIPFLKWLLGNMTFDNDSIIIKLSGYVLRMKMLTGNHIGRFPDLINQSFLKN